MRTRTIGLPGAFLLLLPQLAWAQQAATPPAQPSPASDAAAVTPAYNLGRVDFGVRGNSISGDRARYNRFRDVRDGAYVDRFTLHKETDSWIAAGEADHVGYRDQRFSAAFESFGRVKADFLWDQVPLFISGDTRSLQKDLGNGVLGIDDAVQQAIQAGTLTLSNAMTSATAFDLRSRRHMAAFELTYVANRNVDLTFNVRNTERKGYHLQSFALTNSPGGGIAQELGIPTDQRTTDVKAMVEFGNTRALLTAGMNASWFDNRIPTVQFDNPLRLTDISGGASRGLAPMWPSNSNVSFIVNGSYKLPARTRVLGSLSVGRASQDDVLVAGTINTALVAPPLLRSTAAASADVVSMVYGINSRPMDNVWLNARYRYYDFDNHTPHFEANQLVGDWTLGTSVWETEPLSVRHQFLDLDASFTPINHVAFGVGYGRQDDRRTFRIFEETAENTFRMFLDSTSNPYFTLRLKYERSSRDGSGFDSHLLEEVGEQPEMRHFDVANRDRSRVTSIVTVTPAAWLNLNGSVAYGRDEYKDTGFGLRDNRNRTYGVGFDLMPLATVSAGATYQREKYTANQYSRTANPGPQFEDPTRDWWLDTDDRVNTITAYIDLLKTLPRTDVRLGYDLSDGRVAYVYGLPANQTIFTGTASLRQLAPVTNRLTGGRADVQYFLRANLALGLAYWYEDYDVNDLSLNPTTINSLNIGTATIYSGYLYRPYTAHTTSLRMTYLW